MTATLLFAQAVAQEDRHAVADGNPWSITDSDCGIEIGFGDDAHLWISPRVADYDLGIFDKQMKDVVDLKMIPVGFAVGGKRIGGREYSALGNRGKEGSTYVALADDALLDAIAKGDSLQVYRGKTMLTDLAVPGFAAALAAMRACVAKLPAPDWDAKADTEDADAAAADDATKM